MLQVSKPYTEFFSDEHLKSLEAKESMPERDEVPLEDMEISVPIHGAADDAEQGQAGDQDWGDAGEGEGFDGGFDED